MPSLAVSFAESQKPLLQLEGPPSEDGWSAFEQSSGEVSLFDYADVRNLRLSYECPLFTLWLLLGGAEGSEQKRVSQRVPGRAASAAYPARLNSQM